MSLHLHICRHKFARTLSRTLSYPARLDPGKSNTCNGVPMDALEVSANIHMVQQSVARYRQTWDLTKQSTNVLSPLFQNDTTAKLFELFKHQPSHTVNTSLSADCIDTSLPLTKTQTKHKECAIIDDLQLKDVTLAVNNFTAIKRSSSAQADTSIDQQDSSFHRSENVSRGSDSESSKTVSNPNLPTEEQLDKIKDYYIERVKVIHKKNEDWKSGHFHEDIVFENNFFDKKKRTVGLKQYTAETTKLMMHAMVRFPTCCFEIKDIRTDVERGQLYIHWENYYITNLQFYTQYIPRKFSGFTNDKVKAGWDAYNNIEGLSIIVVNHEGQIIKHKVDRKREHEIKETANLKDKVMAKVHALKPGAIPTMSTEETQKKRNGETVSVLLKFHMR